MNFNFQLIHFLSVFKPSTVILIIILVILGFIFKNKIQEKIAPSKDKNLTIDQKHNAEKREREKEIDQLLNKIGKKGVNDLSEKDRKRLDELSKK